MKGKISISVRNNVLQYKFEIRRNITIIKGDSATGKTTLVDMIRDYDENGPQSGIMLQCDYPCVVVEGRQWKLLLNSIHESIVFIDEGNQFVASDEFANVVKGSDNYFVIISRESLPNLPYSVDEIYGIKSSGKFGSLQPTYQEFYRIYSEFQYGTAFEPEIVLVEDSNSGYEFFESYAKTKSWSVESAKGKSNIFAKMKELQDKKIVVIADGAAFGSEMDRIVKKQKETEYSVIYLPESFEWLILKSELFCNNEMKVILDNPSDFIESKDYMSWERFFTTLLVERAKETYLHYSKSKLNEAYKNPKIQEKIMKVIPENLF